MTGGILKNLKYFGLLILLTIVILISGSLLISRAGLPVESSSFFSLTLIFTIVNGVTLAIAFAGQGRDKKDQPGFTMASVSVKLLAEMVIALVWFIDEKKSAAPNVLLFFILYLSFTLFSVITIVKTLRSKAL
jgi:hypothetical protein